MAVKVAVTEQIEKRLSDQRRRSQGALAEEADKAKAEKAKEQSEAAQVDKQEKKAGTKSQINTKFTPTEISSKNENQLKQPAPKKSVQFDVHRNVEIK